MGGKFAILHTIALLALAGIMVFSSLLIIPVVADTPQAFVLRVMEESGGPVEKLLGQNVAGGSLYLPETIPYPPYVTDSPGNIGTYKGPCPIGGNAPQLRDTGLSTGALCRGACGMDCPDERCKAMEDWTLKIEGGTCTYRDVKSCDSHQGCRDHDACYDYCSEKRGEKSIIFGSCHGVCNSRCYAEYGLISCGKWAAIPGSIYSTLGWLQDSVSTPETDKSLIFSDKPVFTPDPGKTVPPVTGVRYPAYLWAISSGMWNDPECSAKIYYTDSGCSEDAFIQNKCGQIPPRCVDTSQYRNGITREFTYVFMLGNQERKADGWDISYRSDGTIQNADHYNHGELSETCSPAISATPGSGDTTLHCHAIQESVSVGETFTRDSVSLSDT